MGTRTRIFLQIGFLLLALISTLAVGALLIMFVGKNPLDIYSRIFLETLGSPYGIGQVLFKATTIICTGLSAAVAFRAGLFTIGAEGQLIIGGFCIALVGSALPGLPFFLLIPLCLLAGAVGGALWGAIPGFLKAQYGAHEVINTMMMNFIAMALISYFVNNIFSVPATIHTREIADAAQLPRLENVFSLLKGSPVNVSFFISLIACLLTAFFISSTRIGYELEATGLNPDAATYNGINTKTNTLFVMSLSGAIAGIGGSNFVMGYKHYYEIGFTDGAGFIGIAAALLAKNNPLGIIASSIFFGILEYGGLTINTIIPKDLMNILQAMIIIFTLFFARVSDRVLAHYVARTTQRLSNA